MGPQDEAGLRRWVETALANAEAGTERPFATIDRGHGPGDRQQPLHVDRARAQAPRDRLDVGRRRAFQRTGANREAKLLQLTHAFETLGANRVEFKTHCPQRALAQRAGRDRRDVRGRLPEPHDHARRVAPRLRLLQRHRRGVAGGQGRASSPASTADRRRRSLDRDILAGRPSAIIDAIVAMTVVGGQVVHRSEAPP